MPTEEDLRVAFRDLERLAPDTADVLRPVYDPPRRRVRRAGLALGAAAALAAAAMTAAVTSGPAAAPITASALRTRLLAAIDTASGDILFTRSPGGPLRGGQYPAYPRPGQKVHVRVGPAVGSDGEIYKDGEYSFAMPAQNPARNYTSHLDQGGLQLDGTLLVVNHFRHVWGVWHGRFELGFTLNAAGIRAEIANGQFTVVGRTELHGQQAIELKINVPPSDQAPPHTVAARLWVDAATYLPMREDTRRSTGQQSVSDFVFLPPTPANLAKLRPVIPAGYTHVSGNSAELFGHKPQTRGSRLPASHLAPN
jgi:hypothetical protein